MAMWTDSGWAGLLAQFHYRKSRPRMFQGGDGVIWSWVGTTLTSIRVHMGEGVRFLMWADSDGPGCWGRFSTHQTDPESSKVGIGGVGPEQKLDSPPILLKVIICFSTSWKISHLMLQQGALYDGIIHLIFFFIFYFWDLNTIIIPLFFPLVSFPNLFLLKNIWNSQEVLLELLIVWLLYCCHWKHIFSILLKFK